MTVQPRQQVQELYGTHGGIILPPGRLGSIVEVKRIEGPVFGSKEAAEEHALQLCKEWIDARHPLTAKGVRR